MKKILIILPVLLIFGGGGYWYVAIYQVRQYAEAAIPIYREWREGQYSILERSSAIYEKKGAYDFSGAFAILKSLEEFLQQEQTNLSLLKPPLFGVTKQFHSDFLEFMDKNLETVSDAKRRAGFLIKARAYQDLFLDKTASPISMGSSAVNEIRARYESVFPKAKTLGNELFKEEIVRLSTISFSQLQVAWEDAFPVFDLLLTQVRVLNSNDPEAVKTFILSGQKLENFNELIREVIRLNSVYDLLSDTSTGEVPIFTGNGAQSETTAPKELVTSALRLHDGLWNLLQKYPHLSVGHNVDQPTLSRPPALEEQPEQSPL